MNELIQVWLALTAQASSYLPNNRRVEAGTKCNATFSGPTLQRLSIVADIDMMRKIGLEKQDATKNKWVEVLPAFAKK